MSGGPILIMAGGTGGHVFPALAAADALRALGRKVVWLGSTRGIENRIVPAAGIPLERVRVAGLRGKGVLSWLAAPFRLVIAVWDALRIVRRLDPTVVLGMGGFASGPGGLAAWLLRAPLVIHEQNAAPGLTNRLLAGLAREVLEAFPGSFSARVGARSIGNPVRAEIAALEEPAARFRGRSNVLRLLVLGGSQGARALNEIVPLAVAKLDRGATEVWHQSGESMRASVEETYTANSVEARVDAFIDDMAAAYAWADLVVCRAGALTVSELAAAGLGAILVPFPSAVDDHQTRNAEYLVQLGAAVLLPQSQLSPDTLATELRHNASDRAALERRAELARSFARPDATEQLVRSCLAQEAAA